jgi:methylenetetrahydrofolate reductase (NADPH)
MTYAFNSGDRVCPYASIVSVNCLRMPDETRSPLGSTGGVGTNGPVELLRNVSYEVVPLGGAEQAVLAAVPTSIPLTVTVTEARGMEATLRLAERLTAHGYRVAPHLAARQFTDRDHVADVVERLRAAGVRSAFVIAGDSPSPRGAFPDAYSLLQAMASAGHSFEEIGIAGYPEGHARISREAIDLAVKQKAPMAHRIISQICFDAAATTAWASRIAACGIGLPVHVGVPGPVNRQKLVRISAGLGLGQSARFLSKQQGLLWRLLLPGGYDPTRLVTRLGSAVYGSTTTIAGLHIFTFNELAKTERWRRELLGSLADSAGPT